MDQVALHATSAEQYVDLEISKELIKQWKALDYVALHLGAVRLMFTVELLHIFFCDLQSLNESCRFFCFIWAGFCEMAWLSTDETLCALFLPLKRFGLKKLYLSFPLESFLVLGVLHETPSF